MINSLLLKILLIMSFLFTSLFANSVIAGTVVGAVFVPPNIDYGDSCPHSVDTDAAVTSQSGRDCYENMINGVSEFNASLFAQQNEILIYAVSYCSAIDVNNDKLNKFYKSIAVTPESKVNERIQAGLKSFTRKFLKNRSNNQNPHSDKFISVDRIAYICWSSFESNYAKKMADSIRLNQKSCTIDLYLTFSDGNNTTSTSVPLKFLTRYLSFSNKSFLAIRKAVSDYLQSQIGNDSKSDCES